MAGGRTLPAVLGRRPVRPQAEVEGLELVTADELARRFSFTAKWVREHADELGVIRVGNGRRPRLRFNPATALERLIAADPEESGGKGPPARKPAPGQRRRTPTHAVTGTGAPLLPVGGRKRTR